jgi:hypothetical protein
MKFKRMMIDGKGKTHQPGETVPDGFSTELGLAEMIRVGDIEDPKQPEKEFDCLDVPIENELLEKTHLMNIELSEIENTQEPIQEPVIEKPTKRGRKAGK